MSERPICRLNRRLPSVASPGAQAYVRALRSSADLDLRRLGPVAPAAGRADFPSTTGSMDLSPTRPTGPTNWAHAVPMVMGNSSPTEDVPLRRAAQLSRWCWCTWPRESATRPAARCSWTDRHTVLARRVALAHGKRRARDLESKFDETACTRDPDTTAVCDDG